MDLERYIINTSGTLPSSRIFSRHSKFPVEDLLAFMIMPRTESTAVELAEFAKIFGKEPVCKQTFFMKRRLIKDSIFDDINKRCVEDMYSAESTLRTWKGLYLLAFDGTTLKLPDTPEIVDKFPKNKKDDSQPLARMEMVKDVLNGTIVDLKLDTMGTSEVSLAIRSINSIPREQIDKSLLIFDRGYIGAAWFTWLYLNDIQYIVRLPRGFNKEIDAFFASEDETADVVVEMSDQNWNRRGKNSFEALGIDPDNCPPVMLHLVKCKLPTGETEVLALRLKAGTPSCGEAYVVYGDRWGVETSIDEIKNELQLEIFSGNSVLCVLQDIKAKIVAYNMGVAIAQKATHTLEKSRYAPEMHDGHAIRIKVNLNVGWHYLKTTIARMLVCPCGQTESILTETLNNLKRNVEVYELDRHLPHSSGSKHSRGKYVTFTNYKRAI